MLDVQAERNPGAKRGGGPRKSGSKANLSGLDGPAAAASVGGPAASAGAPADSGGGGKKRKLSGSAVTASGS